MIPIEILKRSAARRLFGGLAIVTLLVAFLATPAFAVPMLFGYQGAVFDDTGQPELGPVDIEVAIYDTSAGGSPLFHEAHDTVGLVDGAFDIEVGSGTDLLGQPLDLILFDRSEVWLELVVEGEPLSPRQRVLAVPYALRAAVAESLDEVIGTVPHALVADRLSSQGSGISLGVNLDENGLPTDDGVRFGLENDYFGTGLDAFVFEKTGVSGPDPDGGFVFANTGNDGVFESSLVIDGSGNVGIGTDEPTNRFHVVGNSDNAAARIEQQGNGFALRLIGNGSERWDATVRADNYNTNLGMAAWFTNDSGNATSRFDNAGPGPALALNGNGSTAVDATVRAKNGNPDKGMAGYFINNSNYATSHFQNDGSGQVLWLENNGEGDFIVAHDASLPPAERLRFWIDDQGVTNVRTLRIHGGADLSESFDIRASGGDGVEPGTVVSIDPSDPGKLMASGSAYDRTVAGVVAGAGGIAPGMLLRQQGTIADGAHPVALSGRVYVRADVSSGPIRPGDLLTTSAKPGHAMRVSDGSRAHGAVLGKAMGSLDEGEGLVMVLVNLQ